jgi:hypothetical protein
MKNLLSAKWWSAAGARAIKTFAQAIFGTMSGAALLSDLDWKIVLSGGVFAAIYSLVSSLSGLPEVDETDQAPDT